MTGKYVMRSRMVVGTSVVTVAASGCGNAIDTDIVGRAALARDADGSVLVLVDACRGSVDSIGIYAGRDGLADSEVNPTLGEIRASSPQSGRIEVPLTAPADPWAAICAVRLSEDPDSLFIVIASLKDENDQAAQGIGNTERGGCSAAGAGPHRVVAGGFRSRIP